MDEDDNLSNAVINIDDDNDDYASRLEAAASAEAAIAAAQAIVDAVQEEQNVAVDNNVNAAADVIDVDEDNDEDEDDSASDVDLSAVVVNLPQGVLISSNSNNVAAIVAATNASSANSGATSADLANVAGTNSNTSTATSHITTHNSNNSNTSTISPASVATVAAAAATAAASMRASRSDYLRLMAASKSPFNDWDTGHGDGAAAGTSSSVDAEVGGSSGAGIGGAKPSFFFGTSSFSLHSRKEVAALINTECCRGGPTPDLDSIMDTLFNPGTPIDNLDNIEWIRWLIAGGRTPQEFVKIVRSYDNHAKCGLVWVPHVVAYRCRTCGISPCMSICRDCFKKGDHTNHDFNMFLSQAGGACDCGDTSVMKAEGFCSDHGINNRVNRDPVPNNLLAVAEVIMPKLLFRLLQHFRENSDATLQTHLMAAYSCEEFANMLIDLNNMGEIMRKVMTRALINPEVYRYFMETPCLDTRHGRFLKANREKYEDAVNRFPSPEPPDDYKHLPALGEKLVHTTLLEEFIFWTFKFEFPQTLVCFLLNMLPDQDYKEHLTRTFVMHYSRIPTVLEMSRDPDTLSNRVVHMSVQLFSNESLALKMVNELSLLHVMIISLKLMMSKILIQNTLHDPAKNFHFVIDCTRQVMKDHCYWPLVSDFNNVLSHESVALVFLRDDNLIDMWFQFLSMLQGMNVNVRETASHVEFEPNSYYAAFSCELEASAYPMWSIISHLQDGTHAHLAKKIIDYCVNTLHEWLDSIYFMEPKLSLEEMMQASFHFPLHRYLAAFVCQAVTKMGMSLTDVLPSRPYILPLLMIHPLRVQSFFYEILAGKWVRNGLQIKGQAMTYIQANFCNSMADMDLFFLQICATNLPQFFFLQNTIELFDVGPWLETAPLKQPQKTEQSSMLEGFLTFLATLVTSRTNLGNDEATQCIIEISALLATENKTHSQLLELMPERSGNVHTKNFEKFLKKLSVYKAPSSGSENLEQGLFTPIDEVWEQYYDPLHVLLRAVHRRDFQSSLDRFTNYVKSKNKMPISGNLWPPFRLPMTVGTAFTDPCRILNSRVFHSTILSILFRAVHSRDVSEHLLALAIFLLEIAVETSSDMNMSSDIDKPPAVMVECEPKHKTGYPLYNRREPPKLFQCYPTDNLSCNLRHIVSKISQKSRDPQVTTSNYRSNPFYADLDFDVGSDNDTIRMIGDGFSEDEYDDMGGASGGGGTHGAGRSRGVSQALVPVRLAGMEVALPPDLSVVAETGVVLRQDSSDDDPLLRDAESTIELATPALDFHFPLQQITLPESGMEVAIRRDLLLAETTNMVLQPSMGNREIAGVGMTARGNAQPSEMFSPTTPTGSGMLLPFQRVQPVAVPSSSNMDIVPSNALGAGLASTSRRHHHHHSYDTGTRKRTVEIAIGGSNKDEIVIEESILSLLLKLHSQLSGTLDSFSLSDGEVATKVESATETTTKKAASSSSTVTGIMAMDTVPEGMAMDTQGASSDGEVATETESETETTTMATATATAKPSGKMAMTMPMDTVPDGITIYTQCAGSITGSGNAMDIDIDCNEASTSSAAAAEGATSTEATGHQHSSAISTVSTISKKLNHKDIHVATTRVGDGPFFIGNLLRKMAKRDEMCAQNIDDIRQRLWPNQREKQAEQMAREAKEKEERRKRARERQQKMMQDFANKQKQFMQSAAAAAHDMECCLDDDEDEEELYEEQPREKEYDCIICNCTTPSTEMNPIGLVVLVESSGIVGHRRRLAERLPLPLCAEDEERLKQSTRLATEFERRTELLSLKFGEESWYLSNNMAYDNGVHVQSCGHHVHLSCLEAYLKTLYATQRQPLQDRGEFYCPVCRQLSNSVLPLSPALDRPTPVVRSGSQPFEQLVSELTDLIKENEKIPPPTKLSEAMGHAMEVMTNITQRKAKRASATFRKLFIFVTSIARTNLEAEIIQRGGSLCTTNATRYKPKRDCIVPLLHVLSVHVRVLVEWPLWRSWASLAGLPVNDVVQLPAHCLELIPSLLADPIALLLKFILLAPLHLDQEYFTCMVKVMYNLLYYQIVVQMCVTLTDLECDYIVTNYVGAPSAEVHHHQQSNVRRNATRFCATPSVSYLGRAMALVLKHMNRLSHLRRDSIPSTSTAASAAAAAAAVNNSTAAATSSNVIAVHGNAAAGSTMAAGGAAIATASTSAQAQAVNVNLKSMEMQLQGLCLPFLRIAALLRQHLYRHEMPEITAPGLEFVRLVYYLELVTDSMDWDCFNASKGLCFIPGTEETLPQFWCKQLMDVRPPTDTLRELVIINQHALWQQPKLLELPREYERLFTYYHERPCLNCYKVPKESSICLLCGTIVCLKQNCCAENECCEAVRHTLSCGGGIGIFLVVTSTYIIVIRGRRACLWGSLYLDDFDEEDRDLKRGKPLYLSQDRFNLLESQWLSHKFAHTKHTWVFHRDLL